MTGTPVTVSVSARPSRSVNLFNSPTMIKTGITQTPTRRATLARSVSLSMPPTRIPSPSPTSSPTAVPTPSPTAVVKYDLTQLITGMQLSRWNSLGGNDVYQKVVIELIGKNMGVTQVLVKSSSYRRRLQSSASTNVMVTTSITGTPSTQAAVEALLKQTNIAGVNTIIAQIRQVSLDWNNLQAQPVYASSDPVPLPTAAPSIAPSAGPTTTAELNSANSASSGTIGGLPQTTLIAIVVVLVVVVLAVAVVACRNSGSSKKSVVVDPYGLYASSNGAFSSVSPVHGARRPSYGAPQQHRGSRGSGVEMLDTYGVTADNYNRASHDGANPGFGSARLSSGGRASFGGDQGGRRSSFEGVHPRAPGNGQFLPPGQVGAPSGAPNRVNRF